MREETLLAAFERGQLPPGGFGHRDHVRVAWQLLRTLPLPEAIGRFSRAARNLAKRHGHPEKYHETITFAYLFVIHERMQSEKDDWIRFVRQNRDLLEDGRSLLQAYYPPGFLDSEQARRSFLLPPPAFTMGSGKPGA